MSTSPIIEIKNLSKQYQLREFQPYYTFRDRIANFFTKPFKKKSEDNDQTFWALKDINFEVKPGEVIGVIGPNGAGKSTLLKVLSRITPPTKGSITMHGRLASLLEVGTGFHPELTGRENIYLNGIILGMKRKEIEKKFDEIVAFSEIERFLDMPVKRYSSGMYVRLAFAVAAHLEQEILLIDEVLAVGDYEFQKRCLKKMDDISKQDGRTVFLVSHNMDFIKQLCTRCIFLQGGQVQKIGSPEEVIQDYLKERSKKGAETVTFRQNTDKPINLRKVTMRDHTHNPSTTFELKKPFSIEIEYEVNQTLSHGNIYVTLYSEDGKTITHLFDTDNTPEGKIERTPGSYRTTVTIQKISLNTGNYNIGIAAGPINAKPYDSGKNVLSFSIKEKEKFRAFPSTPFHGVIAEKENWSTEKLK